MKRTIQIVISAKFNSQQLWWFGVVLVPMVWGRSVKASLMLKGAYRYWSNTLLLRWCVFQDIPAYLRKAMPRHILHLLQQSGFIVKECRYCTVLPAVQTCLPLKMYGTLRNTKYGNGDPGLLNSLKLFIKQEWEWIPLSQHQKLDPNTSWALLKRIKKGLS